MALANVLEKAFRRFLPSPFAIAILLTLITIGLALAQGKKPLEPGQLAQWWENGLWNPSLLVFMVQMMLILVLGHTLALAGMVNRLIKSIVSLGKTPALSAFYVCLFTLLTAFVNWGLGLIVGALLARKSAEYLQSRGLAFNYGILGAAGYSSLMVWHGGLSGSSLLKVAETGHLQTLGNISGLSTAQLPTRIDLSETVFSTLNLLVSLFLLIALPLLCYGLARIAPTKKQSLKSKKVDREKVLKAQGAERIDQSLWTGRLFGLLMLAVGAYLITDSEGLSFLNPNFINLSLFGMGLLAHGSLNRFTGAVGEAIFGATGILIQFPLYFGIMGLMSGSGLVTSISESMSNFASANTLPILTFFNAGLVNVFVPSGGGQWAIQGPIILESAIRLGVDLPKAILALAYGDQVTNMLQPFWALPLLGITGLNAREIIPYSLILMCVGSLIFLSFLYFG